MKIIEININWIFITPNYNEIVRIKFQTEFY